MPRLLLIHDRSTRGSQVGDPARHRLHLQRLASANSQEEGPARNRWRRRSGSNSGAANPHHAHAHARLLGVDSRNSGPRDIVRALELLHSNPYTLTLTQNLLQLLNLHLDLFLPHETAFNGLLPSCPFAEMALTPTLEKGVVPSRMDSRKVKGYRWAGQWKTPLPFLAGDLFFSPKTPCKRLKEWQRMSEPGRRQKP